jgi:hypothetical protein
MGRQWSTSRPAASYRRGWAVFREDKGIDWTPIRTPVGKLRGVQIRSFCADWGRRPWVSEEELTGRGFPSGRRMRQWLAGWLFAFCYPLSVTRMIVLPGTRRSGANADGASASGRTAPTTGFSGTVALGGYVIMAP